MERKYLLLVIGILILILAVGIYYFGNLKGTTGPTISNIDPQNNATSVTRNKNITVTFSEPVKWGTKNIEIYANNTKVLSSEFNMNLNNDGNTLTISPTSLWVANTNYQILFHSGCVWDGTNNLAGTTRNFKTRNT